MSAVIGKAHLPTFTMHGSLATAVHACTTARVQYQRLSNPQPGSPGLCPAEAKLPTWIRASSSMNSNLCTRSDPEPSRAVRMHPTPSGGGSR